MTPLFRLVVSCPMRRFFSRIATWRPPAASAAAQARPTTPAPITATSMSCTGAMSELRPARQRHGERGALAAPAEDGDRAPERLDDLLHDPQAEPGAGVARAGGALEGLKDSRQVLVADADAAVAHQEPRGGGVALDDDVDGRAGAVLEGAGAE